MHKYRTLSHPWAYEHIEQAVCLELEGVLFCEGGVYHQEVQKQTELWLQGGNDTLQDTTSTL